MPNPIIRSSSYVCLQKFYHAKSNPPDSTCAKGPAQVDASVDLIKKFIATQSPKDPCKAAVRLLQAAVLVEPMPELKKDADPRSVYLAVQELMPEVYADFTVLSACCEQHEGRQGDGGTLMFTLQEHEKAHLQKIPSSEHEPVKKVYRDLREKMSPIPTYILVACLLYLYGTEELNRMIIEIEKQEDFSAWAKILAEVLPPIKEYFESRDGKKLDLSPSTLPEYKPADAALVKNYLELFHPGTNAAALIDSSEQHKLIYELYVSMIASNKLSDVSKIDFERAHTFMAREDVQAAFKAYPPMKKVIVSELGAFYRKIVVQAFEKAGLPTVTD